MELTLSHPVVIVSLSDNSLDLTDKLRSALLTAGIESIVYGKCDDARVHVKFNDTIATLRDAFEAGKAIVALCSSGIVIRAIAPCLEDKFDEPPVLSIARDGSAVVPLVGGHHGANDLAQFLAHTLKAEAAVTTAGDCKFKLGLDTPPAGWTLQNRKDAAPAMARLIDDAPVWIDPALGWLSSSAFNRVENPEQADILLRSSIYCQNASSGADDLVFSPRKIAIGVGCERGVDADHVIAHIEACLADNNLSTASLASLASIDLKCDEAALHAAAAHFGIPVRFFSPDMLEAQKDRLENPSDVVFAEVGCHGVAEGAALCASGIKGELLQAKKKTPKATCAIGLSDEIIMPDQLGIARGRLSVVGIGPGQSDWRSPEATQLISEAEELVGYGLYIDLLGSLAAHKPRSDFPLGGEEARCRYALEEAAKGKNVALICSGDAGIYAMGALVMELLDRPSDQGGVSAAAKRVEIVNAPGISALQAASARFGALLGHDFCTVSLSDLLTPWEAIEQRLRGAAEGDFVIAFYNPVSKKRRTQLAAAKEILLQHRPADCPVLLASNLGRPTEALRLRTLETLEVDEVDMLTVVLVGSSQSKSFKTGDVSVGDKGWRAYTPRGYAKRIDAKPDQT